MFLPGGPVLIGPVKPVIADIAAFPCFPECDFILTVSRGQSHIHFRFGPGIQIGSGIHDESGFVGKLLYGVGPLVLDLGTLIDSSSFCSHQDDPVSGSCTIDGSRRILQHTDGFDHVGIHAAQLSFLPINEDKWTPESPDADPGIVGSRLARDFFCNDPCHLSFQQIG